VTRTARIAIIVSAVVLVCTIGTCVVVLTLAPTLTELAGCPTSAQPEMSGVYDDAKRVRQLLPALGEPESAHWRWREVRPRTCPEIAPMDVIFEGFAVLPPDRLAALQAGYPWEPTAAPEVPAELAAHAPAAPAWRRSAAFNSAAQTLLWLDPASRTAYFTHLQG
jgi:hypothetical protein